jgi:L-lactate dehydrogenase complex protein LldG
MASARETILANLRSAREHIGIPAASRVPVDPLTDASSAQLEARFIEEAKAVGVDIHTPRNQTDALELLGGLVGNDKEILGWEPHLLPIMELGKWFKTSGIAVELGPKDGVRLGVTGVDSALATTGSLILATGQGKGRSASLLPEVHVAIVARRQIVANLEVWLARLNSETVGDQSNIVIITGPSRTADIGMELVMGAHGPREMHVILI